MDGKYVAVDASASKDRFNGIVNMNKTAAFIAETLRRDVTMEEIVTAMTDKYDVTMQVAKENALRLINELKQAGLLV